MDIPANSTSFPVCNSSIKFIYTSWVTAYLLFLPVFLFVLYIGFNKWKNPQSSTSGSISHSDVFTLNMVTMEMTSIVGSCVACYGYFSWDVLMVIIGGTLNITTCTGQMLFHSLTCVERYLAVVHPVTYIKLKKGAGVTIRNISIAFVWLFCVPYSLILGIVNTDIVYVVPGFVLMFLITLLITFCSVSVLCVLIRPKPGGGGRDRKQIDQSKRTTVYTMKTILGVLSMRLIVIVVQYTIAFTQRDKGDKVDLCVVSMASLWFYLPSSLVLPMLFLHRAGKLKGCCTPLPLATQCTK